MPRGTTARYEGPVATESFTAENETICDGGLGVAAAGTESGAIAVDGLAFLRRLLG